jgi:MFS family permease
MPTLTPVNPEASYLLWTDRRGRELVLLGTGAAVALGLVAVGIAPPAYLRGGGAGPTLALFGLAWLAFVAGALLVGRLPVRWAVPLILLGGLALRLAAFTNRPAVPYRPFQLVATAFALATTVLLLVGLRRLGHDPRRAVWWAWCPTVAIEADGNAHLGVVVAFLTALGLLLLAWGRGRRAVAWYAVMLVLAAAGAALGAVYLPHPRFALLAWLVPPRWATGLVVLTLLVCALAVARTSVVDRPWLGAATMVGVSLLVATPGYPWYALLLVVLVALGGRAAWLTVAAAANLVQYANELHVSPPVAQRLAYGVAGLAVLGSWLWLRQRRGRGTRSDPGRQPSRPANVRTGLG